MAAHLPDPAFGHDANTCLRCAYPLEGMPEDGRCPECGLPFHAAADTLVLHGVGKTQETRSWRRAAWIALAILLFLYTQAIVPLILYKPSFAGILGLILLAALIAMIITGAPRTRATERFVITPSGLSRSDPDGKHPPTFTLWDAPVYADLRKISPVWRRLRLTSMPSARGAIHLDAGIRCPEEHLPEVERVLDTLADAQNPCIRPDNPVH